MNRSSADLRIRKTQVSTWTECIISRVHEVQVHEEAVRKQNDIITGSAVHLNWLFLAA